MMVLGVFLISKFFDYNYEVGNQHIKQYYVYKHLCSDTWVGLKAIYLDDELVGYSNQTSRKGGIEYAFVSEEAAIKLREFILSCCDNEVLLISNEEEIADYHNCYYASQLLVPIGTEGAFNGNAVILVQYDRSNSIKKTVIVKDKNTGEEMEIPCIDFHYPLSVV